MSQDCSVTWTYLTMTNTSVCFTTNIFLHHPLHQEQRGWVHWFCVISLIFLRTPLVLKSSDLPSMRRFTPLQAARSNNLFLLPPFLKLDTSLGPISSSNKSRTSTKITLYRIPDYEGHGKWRWKMFRTFPLPLLPRHLTGMQWQRPIAGPCHERFEPSEWQVIVLGLVPVWPKRCEESSQAIVFVFNLIII